MPVRPVSAGKKGGKKSSSPPGKKGKKKSSKGGLDDPHQEQIQSLIREREEIRSKLNLICSKIMENVNMDDYQNEVDLTKQQPSDISTDHLLSMVDQICYYRIAFLNLFQEVDDNEKISVHHKITQLAMDEPDMFRKRLTADQRLTFVTRERDLWKENAQLLQIMYANLVDQVEMETFKKATPKTEDVVRNHRLNLEDICLIFSAPRIRSINDAQKVRAKKTLDDVLDGLRDQHAFFDLEAPAKQQEIVDSRKVQSYDEIPSKLHSSNRTNTNERRSHQSSSAATRRSVSFADEVNVFNDDDEADIHQPSLPSTVASNEHHMEDHLSASPFVNSSSLIMSSQNLAEEKYIDSDYYSISSSSSFPHQQYDIQAQIKYNLPPKYRLPLASEVLVNKMDSNLRMLIIKELSKSGHNERPLSRMSSAYGMTNNNESNTHHQHRRQQTRSSPSNESPEWVELARLIGIDESEIDHWLSQNLQYPAGRVISAWCNYASPPPTVAELHSLVSSKEVNRPDLARYIETMYIVE